MDSFERSVERFDEFAEEYAKRFMDIDSYRSSIDKFCDLIISDKPKILELACGPGNVTRYIKNRFSESEFIAIDLAPKMIEIAKYQVKGVDFRVMDVRDILSFDTKFEAIMCSFCLPFLSKIDTQKLIADCSMKLVKNGVIYISTMEGDESRAGFETTSFSGESKVYFNYHKQQDIEAALFSNGFIVNQINRQKYYELDGSVTIDLIFIAIKK
jgi:ubiquinone/menaquinone biosynthesis C-methylase UbiE